VHLRNLIVGSLATVALLAPGRLDAQAQTEGTIRIGSPTAKVMSRRNAGGSVMLTAHEGDTFALLNREEEWYWVMLPADIHGGRTAGWIHGTDIEGSEYRAAAEQKALEEAQAKAAKELQKIERERAKEAAAKDAALRAKQQEVEARQAAEESRRLREAAEQLEKARREYENSIKGAVPPSTSQIMPQESIVTRSVAAADFGESLLP
jgi:flagellar biosynthesis GTPase FlhF